MISAVFVFCGEAEDPVENLINQLLELASDLRAMKLMGAVIDLANGEFEINLERGKVEFNANVEFPAPAAAPVVTPTPAKTAAAPPADWESADHVNHRVGE